MNQSRTLYIVADGGRARLIERTEAGAFRTTRLIESSDVHSAGHELARSRPGRVHESANAARHAVEPRLDPRRKAEEKFIGEVADVLNRDVDLNSVRNVVLVAPARVLGSLRDGLKPELSGRVCEAIAKDLTKIPDPELVTHLPVVPKQGPLRKPA